MVMNGYGNYVMVIHVNFGILVMDILIPIVLTHGTY